MRRKAPAGVFFLAVFLHFKRLKDDQLHGLSPFPLLAFALAVWYDIERKAGAEMSRAPERKGAIRRGPTGTECPIAPLTTS